MGCRVFGISAWNLNLDGAKKRDLVITRHDEPQIAVDNLEVAQFIYLLLHNEKIRDVIDTIGKKGVLLLGRFSGGRIALLERLREELRRRDFIPIMFNFEKPDAECARGSDSAAGTGVHGSRCPALPRRSRDSRATTTFALRQQQDRG
jgi:hypothetical protein